MVFGRRAKQKLTKAEMEYRLHRLMVMAPWYGRALIALALTLPLGVTTWLLQEFAGQDTKLDISIVASVSLAGNLMMGYSVWRKSNAMREQSGELNRLRGKVDILEAEQLGRTPKRLPR